MPFFAMSMVAPVRCGDARHSISWGGIAVHAQQVPLVLDRTHCRVDLQALVEALIVRARKVGEKARGPGAAIAPVFRQPGIGMQAIRCRQRHQQTVMEQGNDIGVIADAGQALFFRTRILAHQRFARAAHRRQVDHFHRSLRKVEGRALARLVCRRLIIRGFHLRFPRGRLHRGGAMMACMPQPACGMRMPAF